MTQSVLLRVTFLTVYLFTNTHSPQYSHLLLITSYINSLIILQSVAFLKESQLSQVNLSWMFNWDLFRQCDSWKKKAFSQTHSWVKEDGKSNKWVSCFSCQFPYTISASHCFSFFCISAPMDSPQTWQQEQPIVQKPWAACKLFLSFKVSDMVWGSEEAQTSPGLLHMPFEFFP